MLKYSIKLFTFFLTLALTNIQCIQKENFCNPNPCLNNGSCIISENRSVCLCKMNFYGSNCQFKNLTQIFFPIQDQPNPNPCPDRKCQNTKNIFKSIEKKSELLTTNRNEKKEEGLNVIGIVIPIIIIFFVFCIPFTCRICIYAYEKKSKPIGPSSQIIQTNDETYQVGTVSSLSGSLASVPSQFMYANDFIETNSSPYRSRQSSRTFPENDQMETSANSSKSLPPAYDRIELDKSHDLPSYDQIV